MHMYATAVLVTLACTYVAAFASGLLPFPVLTLITAAITIAIVTFHFSADHQLNEGKGPKVAIIYNMKPP